MVAGLPTRYRSAYFRGRDEIDDLPEGSSRFAPMMAEAQMRSWFRLLRRQAFTVFVMVLAVGCGGIQNINQFASAPAGIRGASRSGRSLNRRRARCSSR